jgi:hypothetical protein
MPLNTPLFVIARCGMLFMRLILLSYMCEAVMRINMSGIDDMKMLEAMWIM